MATPSTPGSNVNNYPQFGVNGLRAGGVIYPITVLMAASSVPSVVSAPVAVSFVSAAAGVWNFTGPSGIVMSPLAMSVSNASAAQLRFFNIVPTAGTMQIMWMQENASGTTVSGVAPAAGDRINFAVYVHSMLDGGAI